MFIIVIWELEKTQHRATRKSLNHIGMKYTQSLVSKATKIWEIKHDELIKTR